MKNTSNRYNTVRSRQNRRRSVSRRRAGKLGKIVAAAFILLICTMSIGPVNRILTGGSSVVQADNLAEPMKYKSIQIMPGDTLWSIAAENKGGKLDDIYDYIDELMACNQLVDTQITSGAYLLIPDMRN